MKTVMINNVATEVDDNFNEADLLTGGAGVDGNTPVRKLDATESKGIDWYVREDEGDGTNILIGSFSFTDLYKDGIVFQNTIKELKNDNKTPYVVAVNTKGTGAKTVFFSKSLKTAVKAGDKLDRLKGIKVQHRMAIDETSGEVSEHYLIVKDGIMSDVFIPTAQ
jgi:hypothetical protein